MRAVSFKFDNEVGMARAQRVATERISLSLCSLKDAGHYVPAVSAKLVSEIKNGNSKINYKGSAIGNGLTDPQIQFKNYAPYLEMYNHYGPNGQAVKPSAITLMKAANPACEALIKGCNANVSNTTKLVVLILLKLFLEEISKCNREHRYLVCVNAYVVCAYSQLLPVQLSGLNPYDIREKCPPGLPLCYNFTLQTSYLNSPDVKKALGVTKSWTTCNRVVDMVMVYAGDWMLNFQQDVAAVLDAGYKVLVYAGKQG